MNRKEQIIKEAVKATVKGTYSVKKELLANCFIKGVNWADSNPKEGLVSIENVCEWFEDVDFEMTYIDSEGLFDKEQFINDFRKAMEE